MTRHVLIVVGCLPLAVALWHVSVVGQREAAAEEPQPEIPALRRGHLSDTALATAVIAAAATLRAEGFRELTELIDTPSWRSNYKRLLADGKAADDIELHAVFERHYRAVLGEFTLASHADRLTEKRYLLKKNLNVLGRAPNKSLHEALVTMASTFAQMVFSSNEFSPEARVNCLLLYGDLNEDEGDIAGHGALPLSKTLPTLISILKNKDGKFPNYMQPVALVGVARYVKNPRSSLNAEHCQEVRQTLARWLKDDVLPFADDLPPELQICVSGEATDVLSILAAREPQTSRGE
jgi:hypothetical protein